MDSDQPQASTTPILLSQRRKVAYGGAISIACLTVSTILYFRFSDDKRRNGYSSHSVTSTAPKRLHFGVLTSPPTRSISSFSGLFARISNLVKSNKLLVGGLSAVVLIVVGGIIALLVINSQYGILPGSSMVTPATADGSNGVASEAEVVEAGGDEEVEGMSVAAKWSVGVITSILLVVAFYGVTWFLVRSKPAVQQAAHSTDPTGGLVIVDTEETPAPLPSYPPDKYIDNTEILREWQSKNVQSYARLLAPIFHRLKVCPRSVTIEEVTTTGLFKEDKIDLSIGETTLNCFSVSVNHPNKTTLTIQQLQVFMIQQRFCRDNFQLFFPYQQGTLYCTMNESQSDQILTHYSAHSSPINEGFGIVREMVSAHAGSLDQLDEIYSKLAALVKEPKPSVEKSREDGAENVSSVEKGNEESGDDAEFLDFES
jgi:hypothetical protein